MVYINEIGSQFPEYETHLYQNLIKRGVTAQRFDPYVYLNNLNRAIFVNPGSENPTLKDQPRFRSAAVALVSLAGANTLWDYINPFSNWKYAKYDVAGISLKPAEKPKILPIKVMGSTLLKGLGRFLHSRATLQLERDQTQIKVPKLDSYWMMKMGLIEGSYPSRIDLTNGARLLWQIASDTGGIKPFNQTDLFTYSVLQSLHRFQGEIEDNRIAQLHNVNTQHTNHLRTYQDVSQIRMRANCLDLKKDLRQFKPNFVPVDAKIGTQTYDELCNACQLKPECGLFALNMLEQGTNLVPKNEIRLIDGVQMTNPTETIATKTAVNLKNNISN